MRKLNCDFYRIVSRGAMQFPDALAALFEQHEVAQRNMALEDGIMVIPQWGERAGGIAGLMVRTRRDLKKVANITTHQIENLALGPEEQLAEICHFFYHPEFRVIVTQRNRNTGGAHRITDYLSVKVGARLGAEIVPSRNGAEKLKLMEDCTRVEIGVSMPEQLSMWANEDDDVIKAIRTIGKLGSKHISLVLSMGPGNRKRRMKLDEVRELVGTLTSISGATDYLKVAGAYYPDHVRETLECDLVNERLKDSFDLGQNPTYDDVVNKLTVAYERHHALLGRFYAPAA